MPSKYIYFKHINDLKKRFFSFVCLLLEGNKTYIKSSDISLFVLALCNLCDHLLETINQRGNKYKHKHKYTYTHPHKQWQQKQQQQQKSPLICAVFCIVTVWLLISVRWIATINLETEVCYLYTFSAENETETIRFPNIYH